MEREVAERVIVENGHDPRFLDSSARYAFLQACQKGPLDLVEAFIVCGMPIRTTTDREPAIIKAAESGKLEHVKLILRYGGSLDTKDIVGDTALHTAANWGHEQLVQQLSEMGATCDTINEKKWTPLSKALNTQKHGMVDVILACGADPDFGRHKRATPIALTKDTASMAKLLKKGADPHLIIDPKTENTLLLARTASKQIDQVKLLLEHGARDVPNRAGWTASMVAKNLAAPDDALAALFEGPSGDTRLQAAAHRGDIRELESLLDECPIDGVNMYGSTALLIACSQKWWEAARWLLKAGADPAIANVYANGPLTTAASNGELELVRELLAAGAPANEGPDGENEAPRSLALVLAASNGHLEVVRALLEAGADIHSEDKFMQTPLFLAASKGRAKVVKLLLENGADPNRGGRTKSPLLIAIPKAHAECVALLVDAGADLEKTEQFELTALHRACDSYRNTKTELADIVMSLIDGGADITKLDGFDRTPFAVAKSSKNQPVVERLERHLTDELLEQHRGDWRAIVAAATSEHVRAFVDRGDVATIRSMIDAGLDMAVFTAGPKPILFDALRLDDPQMATLLVERGVDVHVSRKGFTALFYAASRAHLDLIRTLLARGLDVNAIATEYKTTPLMYAMGKDDAVDLLLEHGADPSPFRGGSSPLMSAAGRGNIEMVRKLLALGVDPNVVNSQKQTALELARSKKHDDVVALLSTHTDVDLRDQKGRTALMRACVRGDASAVDHLIGVGADRSLADERGDTPTVVAAWRAPIARRLGVDHTPFEAAPLGLGDDPFAELRRKGVAILDGPWDPADERNFRGDTALHVAVLLRSAPLVEHLLKLGADPTIENEIGETPIGNAAVIARHVEPAFTEAGHRVDANQMALFMLSFEPFRDALREGDLREVDRLLDAKKVNPHVLGSQTALGMAVDLDDDEMVRLLLDKGCDPLVPSGYKSLTDRAARRGNTAILNRLLYAGVPATQSTFYEALLGAQTGVMSILIENGLEPDVELYDVGADALRALIEVAWRHELEELAQRATKRLRDLVAYG